MFFWRTHRVRRTTLIGVGCVAFLVGLGVVRIGLASTNLALPICGLLFLLFCIKKWWLVALPAVVTGGLLLGIWRGSVVLQNLNEYKPLIGQKVTLRATIRDDPTMGDKGQLDLIIDNLILDGRPQLGSARITSLQKIQPRRGDTIEVEGKLKDGFGGYQMAILYGKIDVIKVGDSLAEKFRRAFSAAVFTNVPEPQASLGLGFLIGLKAMLPKNLNDQLKILGLTHIVVASGYNLTVLVRAARRLLAGRSKYQVTVLSCLLIGGFLSITGFSSSMGRAALVTVLSMVAAYYGRTIGAALLLFFSAAVTAALSPLYVWSDIGWYLSFLSFGGVLLLGPFIEKRFFGEYEPPMVLQIALETTCAQLVTLPLILFIFGQFSVLAIIANLLIEPFIPLAMLLTFLVGIAGLVFPFAAIWLGLPTTWLLSYMTNLSGWMAQIPWAQLQVGISAGAMTILYVIILGLGAIVWRSARKHDSETSPLTGVID